jgi:hypothetical protein
MTQHTLSGRSESELLWFQRRNFLQAAAAWTAMGGNGIALAQSRGNIVELMGDATINGTRLRPEQFIQTGDQIATGPDSTVIFVIGTSAFHIRQNSRMTVERGPLLSVVSALRLFTGAVVSGWGRGSRRQITTPTMTAGIRGTGVYTEIPDGQDGRSYFCNCYGTVELAAGNDQTLSQSTYHQAYWGEAEPKKGAWLTPAPAINHSDEELEFLARLVDQRTAWQISGKKGKKVGGTY